MADYVEQVDPTFVGLTGTLDEVDHAVWPFGLFYEYDLEDSDEYYLVNHTSRTFLVAPDGRLRVTYDLAATQEEIVADLEHLLADEPPTKRGAASS
jgi:protein SCO1/2